MPFQPKKWGFRKNFDLTTLLVHFSAQWFLTNFFAKFKNSSKLCRAISQAQIDLFWKFKNLKSSIFNELHVYHAGMCHFGVFMVFLGTLTDTTMKNRVRKFMIFKNCNFFHTFF